jgi:hypothetical protein
MLHSFKSVLDHRLETEGGRAKLREAFFDPSSGKIRYVAVDVGGWLDTTEIIVDADRLAPPRDEGHPWTLRLSEAELAEAPRWHEGMSEDRIDLTYWPPILVGPFGSTYSPLMLYEQMLAEERGAQDEAPEPPEGDALVRPLQEVHDWIGLPAFGPEGELGKVSDLLFDPRAPRVTSIVLDPAAGGEAIQLPLRALRHRPRQGTHLVFDTILPHSDDA